MLGRIRIVFAFLRRNLSEQILVGTVNRIRLVVYLPMLSVAHGMDTASSGKLDRVMKTREPLIADLRGVALNSATARMRNSNANCWNTTFDLSLC